MAMDLDKKVAFNIPAQDLSAALIEFSKQARLQVIVSDDLTGQTTQGVSGQKAIKQALSQLLDPAGLRYRVAGETSITVSKPAAAETHTTRAGLDSSVLRLAQNTQANNERTSATDSRSEATGGPEGSDEKSSPTGSEADRPGAERVVEEIVVTGTHIRGVTSSPSPIVSITRRDFAESGATTAGEVLRRLPQNFTGGATEHSSVIASGRNGGNQNSNNATSVNLRGLGPSSTLVLLNGRRISAAGLGAFVDVSSIPLTALERIDVVADGASAIYGSDAVGGVVNFILREGFEGAESSVRYGSVTDGALDELNVGQVFGTGWDTGSAMLTLNYRDRSALDASDRGYASALTEGPSHLLPEQRQWGALLNGRQSLGSSVMLSATAYANERESFSTVFSPLTVSQTTGDIDTRQVGGTLALDWQFSPSWSLRVAQTYSRADTEQFFMLESAGPTSFSTSDYVLDSSITGLSADGPIFDLPGGAVRLAVGAERRSESLDRVLGQRTSVAQSMPFARDRDVNAFFTELNMPLIGSQNALPWARRLDLTAAVRHEDYSDFGSTTDPKFGLLWQPLDGLSLRATYGTSFRAPYLNQFDDAFAVGVLFPEGFAPDGRLIAVMDQAPGPNLGPENATTWTAGFDLRPQAIPGLSINATWFSIDYVDRLTDARFSLTPSLDPLLAARFATPADPAVLEAIRALIARDPGQFVDLAGAPLENAAATVDLRLLNTAGTKVSGVDFIVSHAVDTAAGQIRTGLNANYLLKFEEQIAQNVAPIDVVDTVFYPVDLRLTTSLGWSRNGWSATGCINYVDSYRDNQLLSDVVRVSSWTTVDASVAYVVAPGRGRGWGDGLSVRLNALNVLDRPPPTIFDRAASYANPGYDTENGHPLGRYVSLELAKSW
jgi:outer membrane receptor protein involved in Fe transport